VRGNQAHVKNADLRHSSFTVVMQKRKKRKFESPVLNVLTDCKYKGFSVSFVSLPYVRNSENFYPYPIIKL
jgi:hypothetical protein